jgi:predicted MFS family arabinose efflux permease
MIGALYATNMGAHTPFGMEGWRFVFLSVSLVSAVTGVLNHMYVRDEAFEERARRRDMAESTHPTVFPLTVTVLYLESRLYRIKLLA